MYLAAAAAIATADILVNESNFPWNMTIQNQVHQIMDWQKKKLRYSEETLWFPKYYIGWIGIGNCGQKTLQGTSF